MTKAQKFYVLALILALGSMPLLAIPVPRVLAYIPALVGVLGFFTYYKVFKERPLHYVPGYIIVGVLSALMCLSVLWAIDPAVSWDRAMRTVPLLVSGAFLISVAVSMRMDVLEPYLKWLPYLFFMAAGLCCLEISLNYPAFRYVRGDDFDVHVKLAEYNRAAVTMIMLLVPVLVIMRHYHNLSVCLIAAIATIIPLLILGESQSAQLGLVVAVLTFALYPYKREFSYKLAAGIIAVLMLALPHICMWMFRNFAASWNEMPFLGSGDGHAGARLEIWNYLSRYIQKNPLYGFGVEGTKQVHNFGSGEIYQEGQTILHPHNYTLQLWIEFGVIGVLLGAAAIAYSLLRISKMPPAQARIGVTVLFTTLAVASTSYGIWQGWWVGLVFATVVYTIFALRLSRG